MSNALALFYEHGTDATRRIDWAIWHEVEPGSELTIATLDHVLEAVVLEHPATTEDGSEVMPVVIRGRRRQLRMYVSASAGYWNRYPGERYPGCDREVEIDGRSARLAEHRPRKPAQLDLFGGAT